MTWPLRFSLLIVTLRDHKVIVYGTPTPLIPNLVPSPTPSFSSLLSTVKRTASDEKLGVGLGTRLFDTHIHEHGIRVNRHMWMVPQVCMQTAVWM